MQEMRSFKEIINRVNIQEIRSFMLDGIDLSSWSEKPVEDSYEDRLQKGEEPLWKLIENLFPDGEQKDEIYDLLSKAILTNQEVYTELGIRLGANLIFELLKSNPLKEQRHEENNKVDEKKGQDNRMENILEAFLNEQLHVDSETKHRTPEHQALCEKIGALKDQLAETLNDKQKAILEELIETLFDESSCNEQVKFEHGFRLGVLITSEIYYKQDIFL